MTIDPAALKRFTRPQGMPFRIGKIGHVVLNVSNMERSVRFYTEVLGFKVSDVYPEEMVPGGMVFMRCNADHHGVALVGSMKERSPNVELNHMAFEVATLDEVLRARDYLRKQGVQIDFEGRRRAGVQIAVEFRDPDGHRVELFNTHYQLMDIEVEPVRWDPADGKKITPWGLPAQKKWFVQATPFEGVAQTAPAAMGEPMSLERFLAEQAQKS